VTFGVGAVFLLIAGLAARWQWDVLAILVFLGLYLLHNVRRPMNVALVSDQIASEVMAAGLSAESQITTIFMAVLSPILGALADRFGVGIGLACLCGSMSVLALLVRVDADVRVVAEPVGEAHAKR
jgi:MFS-type transporter involved in bile tolerance (Atg22 family)